MVKFKHYLRIALFVLTVPILLQVILMVSNYQQREGILVNTEINNIKDAELLGSRTAEMLDYVDLVLMSVISRPKLFESEEYKIQSEEFLGKTVAAYPQVFGLYILGPGGSQLWKSHLLPDFDQREAGPHILERHLDQFKSFAIVNEFKFKSPYIILSRRSDNPDGTLKFIAVLVLDPHFILASYSDIINDGSDKLFIYDSSFNVFSVIPGVFGIVSTRNFLKTNLAEFMGSSETSIKGGSRSQVLDDVIMTSYQIPGYPFSIGIESDQSVVLTQWRRIMIRNITVLIVLVLTEISILVLLRYIKLQEEDLQQKYTKELEKSKNRSEEALANRELLLREIHHRIKNNLMMVSSIINIYRLHGRTLDEHDLAEIINKINSISLVHEKLYKSDDFRHIDLGHYLRDLLGVILKTFNSIRINSIFDIESIELDSRRMMYLGIVFSELITNAFKYGLKENGNLRITGRLKACEYELSIINDGNPFEPESFQEGQDNKSIGMQIVSDFVESVGGSLEITGGDETRISVRFPVDGDSRN